MPNRDSLGEIQHLVAELIGPERMAGRVLKPGTGLFDELGLSSLEAVSLLAKLEARQRLRLPASQVAITELRTVADLIRQMPGATVAGSGSVPGTDPGSDPVAASMERGARRRRRR